MMEILVKYTFNIWQPVMYLFTLNLNIEPVLTVEWIWPPVGIRVRSLVSDGTK